MARTEAPAAPVPSSLRKAPSPPAAKFEGLVLPQTKIMTRRKRELAVAECEGPRFVVVKQFAGEWVPVGYPLIEHRTLGAAVLELGDRVEHDADKADIG